MYIPATHVGEIQNLCDSSTYIVIYYQPAHHNSGFEHHLDGLLLREIPPIVGWYGLVIRDCDDNSAIGTVRRFLHMSCSTVERVVKQNSVFAERLQVKASERFGNSESVPCEILDEQSVTSSNNNRHFV